MTSRLGSFHIEGRDEDFWLTPAVKCTQMVGLLPGVSYAHGILMPSPQLDCLGLNYYRGTDFARFLQERSDVPFLPEWAGVVEKRAVREEIIRPLYDLAGDIGGGLLVEPEFSALGDLISRLLKEGIIHFPGAKKTCSASMPKTLDELLVECGSQLAAKVRDRFQPRFDPAHEKPSPLVTQLLREPYRAQAGVIEGVCRTLTASKSALLIGEMGTGKTLIGAAIPFVHAGGAKAATIVMCPGHLVGKWKREIEMTVPEAVTVEIRTAEDLERLRAMKGKERLYAVIGKDRAKLHCGWEAVFQYREKQVEKNGETKTIQYPACVHCRAPPGQSPGTTRRRRRSGADETQMSQVP
jgi:hypothetical protein